MAFQKQKAAQEQANWEKQYALSKAAASRSSSSKSSSSKKSSSGSSSTKLTNTSKSTNSSGSVQLSSEARKVLNQTASLQAVSTNKEGYNKLKRDYVYNQYNAGKITNAEADQIFKMLNL